MYTCGVEETVAGECCKLYFSITSVLYYFLKTPFQLPAKTPRRIKLDREKYDPTGRLKRSLKRVRWSGTLMRILWTAGPVTGLGLIGGYYIGYGRFPSLELLIYFVSFTLFTGLIGLFAKVIYDATRGHLQKQGEKDLQNVSDKLGDLILAIRDVHVQSQDGQIKTAEAALQLLRRVELSPYGVNTAFTDLTGDALVGHIMGKIHSYRSVGLYSQADTLCEQHRPQIEVAAVALEEHLPEAARELKTWFKGKKSSLRDGVKREAFFIQRIMSAIELNNPYLMTIRDVEEMIILAFELLNGREIPTLVFSYSGNWKYAEALDNLERKRSHHRIAQARGDNRIRALAAFLRENGVVSSNELPAGLPMAQLIENVITSLDSLISTFLSDVKQKSKSKYELRQDALILETSLELYKMAYEGYRDTRRRHAQLKEAVVKWEKLTESINSNPAELQIGRGKQGLRIKENIIELNDEARLEISRYLSWYFKKERLDGNLYDRFSVSADRDTEQQGELIRRIAIEIALTLEPHVRLSKPEVQRNINATKAIYLGELSVNMGGHQKAELARRMSELVDNSTSVAAEQLAETLVNIYNVNLEEDEREFLEETFGARPEKLKQLDIQQKLFEYSFNFVSEVPSMVQPLKPTWKKAAGEIGKLLK